VNAQIVRDEVSSEQITDIVLDHSYHVATMDYDAELIFTASIDFIENVTASRVDLG
jgi:carboxylesterase